MKRCFTLQLSSLALAGFASLAQAQTPVNLGTNVVTQIGHTFLTGPPLYPNLVIDYFIDQHQFSGGGATLSPVTVDWNTNHVFVLTIAAPPGDMFLVQPSVLWSGKFSGNLQWTNGAGAGYSFAGSVAVDLTDLQGVMPDFSQSVSILDDNHGTFGFETIDSAPFIKEIAFTSMVITGTVVPQTGEDGAAVFTPTKASSLGFISVTSQSNDPGPRVSIVPFDYRLQAPFEIAPTVNFVVDDDGNFLVNFIGTLQSSSQPGGPFTDVPGHPLTIFSVPKANQRTPQFFRTRYTH